MRYKLTLHSAVRACWEQNLDVANNDVLKQAIDNAGFSGAKVLEQANDQKVKSDLRSRTQEAKDVGICGVPSCRIFHRKAGSQDSAWSQIGDIVWGQDLIADVEDYIAGWDGQETASVEGASAGTGRSSKL